MAEMKQQDKEQELKEKIKALQDSYYGVDAGKSVTNRVNVFINKWCNGNIPHLLDDDENDGQELRVWVYQNLIQAELKGIQSERQRILKIIDDDINEEKIYARDIFISLSKKELDDIHKMLKEKMNIPIDRLSAHYCRVMMNNWRYILKRKIKGENGE